MTDEEAKALWDVAKLYDIEGASELGAALKDRGALKNI
jgi:hypothetical protein